MTPRPSLYLLLLGCTRLVPQSEGFSGGTKFRWNDPFLIHGASSASARPAFGSKGLTAVGATKSSKTNDGKVADEVQMTSERRQKRQTVKTKVKTKAKSTPPRTRRRIPQPGISDDPAEPGELIPASRYSATNRTDSTTATAPASAFTSVDVPIFYRHGTVVEGRWVDLPNPPKPHRYISTTEPPSTHIIDLSGRPWRDSSALDLAGVARYEIPPSEDLVDPKSKTPIPWDGIWTGPTPTLSTSRTNATTFKISPDLLRRFGGGDEEDVAGGDSDLSTEGEVLKARRGSHLSLHHFEPDDERWMVYMDKLADFSQVYGHTNVPKLWSKDAVLGRWVNRQRSFYKTYVKNGFYEYERLVNKKTGKYTGEFGSKIVPISPWRIQMLYDLGFDFTVQLTWEDRYEQMAEFRERHGHVNVPCADNLAAEEEEYPGLNSWINTQRVVRRKVEADRSDPRNTSPRYRDRIKRLERLGLDFEPRETAFRVRLEQLRAFRSDHGHCNVPKDQDHMDLYLWLREQRKNYRLFQGDSPWESPLTEERIDGLNSLGVEWDPADAAWEERLAQLEEFYVQHGDANVPKDYRANPSLSNWVRLQRDKHRDGFLSDERRAKLEELGFVFSVYDDAFERGIDQLVSFRSEYGHANVPRAYHDRQLWNFVNLQRQSYTVRERGEQSSLTDKRKSRLDELDFVWNAQETAWERNYNTLVAFRKEYGHCDVPTNFADDPALFRFVNVQRREYKKLREASASTMTEERRARLDAIGFIWNARDARWMERYEQLRRFRDDTGDCNVPFSYAPDPKLGKWVANQRSRKSKLTEERVSLLEDLGFEWSVVTRKRVK